MWNGGHQAWHKSPVTFLQQVRESEPMIWTIHHRQVAAHVACAWH